MGGRTVCGVVGVSLLVALSVACGKTEERADPGASAAGAGGSSVPGASGGVSSGGVSSGSVSSGGVSSGGANGSGGVVGGAPAADSTTGTTPEGSAGAAGASGASSMDDIPRTCEEIPHDDPGDRCEPKLRALVFLWMGSRSLRTFSYDDAGRLVTIGDERSHDSYFFRRYTYDESGRLVRFEEDCTTATSANDCLAVWELTYAEAGWLESLRQSYESSPGVDLQETYDEDGKLLERLRGRSTGADGSIHRYRTDGQLETKEVFTMDESGTRVPQYTELYEYGDDNLLDRIDCRDVESEVVYECQEYLNYIFESGRVRVRLRSYGDSEFHETIVFDDLGFPAFSRVSIQGDDVQVFVDIDSTDRPEAWLTRPEATAASIDPARALRRYGPYELTEDVIRDFSYTYSDIPFSRQVTFSQEGLLEHLTLSWGPESRLELDTLRCGGVVLETVRRTDPYEDDSEEVTVYYYGCDDFVLPSPLPEL